MEHAEIFEGVKAVLTEALVVPPESVTPKASLATDLGADSLDVMDVVVRLNRRFSLKLSAKELATRLRDGQIPGISDGGHEVSSDTTTVNPIEQRRKMAERITVGFLVDAVERELLTTEQIR